MSRRRCVRAHVYECGLAHRLCKPTRTRRDAATIGRRCDFFRSRRRRRATRQLRCGGLSGAHKCTFVHLCCTFSTCRCTINIGENNALLCINMCQKYHPTRMSNCAQFVMRSRSIVAAALQLRITNIIFDSNISCICVEGIFPTVCTSVTSPKAEARFFTIT